MRVLIADDDELSCRALETRLRRWGYETLVTSDGTGAWDVLRGPEAPRLAILDWGMPGMDGPEVCRRVREHAGGDYTYLILLTGRNRSEDIIEGMEAGADDYVTKPARAGELRARLHAATRILELHARVLEEARAREQARERHLRELAEREERLRAILSSLHETVLVVCDSAGRVLHAWADPALSERYGTAIPDMVGKRLDEVLAPRDAEVMAGLVGRVFQTAQPLRGDYCHCLPRGEFWHDVSLCPMRGPSGEVTAAVAFIRDVTEQKRMQDQLHQARKLESVGRLASGIAHEINTPMQYTGDNTRFVQEAFQDLRAVIEACQRLVAAGADGATLPRSVADIRRAMDEADVQYLLDEVPRAIEQSLEGVERVTRIVRAMREFSHPGVEEKAAIDINRAVESTVTVCRNEWKYVAEMEMNLDADLPAVLGFPGELNQVILNLIINAAHAIADVVGDGAEHKGTITITTTRTGPWVEIRVADTGGGIPDHIAPRIFEPFFTTKDVGKGTGQGLAIARSVIAGKHGGEITFRTKRGQGTTFIVRLPLDPADGAAQALAAAPAAVT